VPVLSVNQHEATVFFVTEAISHAETLDKVLKARSPDPRESARWIADIADALAYLDANGIVYRDLKPSAILIGNEGSSRLTSLASCCVLEGGPPPIGIVGTPAYIPPEQVLCEGNVDVRSTVYGLGVVLYELLTGVPAFKGSMEAEILQSVLNMQPRAPRSIRRSIPKDLEAICLKAMAKKPEERYATPADLALALRQFLSDQPDRRRSFWKRK
jgi:serine/threonine protein kinase